MRLNKFISHHGICSRRDADKLIESGRVKVNNKVQNTPYIVLDSDIIMVDDKAIQRETELKIWAFYKPTGIITSHKDENNRPTVFDQPAVQKLRDQHGYIISVGRLDYNSEGLLLLTNSPDFAHEYEKPSSHLKRTYRVRVFGDINYKALDALKNGITIEDIHYKPIHVEYDVKKNNGQNTWMLITLTEGKNREIRRVLNHFDLQVNRLIRVAYGPYSLGDLKVGEIKALEKNE
ncbi:MAG TPA: pseudouridine synthase [Holosporales bacterium]|nr:pseudouridine synthase [Holosporales bacterium]